jgi:BatD DUF11 like domain
VKHRAAAVAIAVALASAGASAGAAEGKPFAWAGLGPKTVTVGEPVTLTVVVYVPTWFTGAPKFPPIDVKDAMVVFLEEGGTNLSQKVGEAEYAGQQRQYLIYPQRAGEFTVRSFTVSVRYAIETRPSPPTAVPAQGGRFTATIPAAAAGLGYFVAAPAFRLTAATDRRLADLKVGDSFTRTITMAAAGDFAVMLPPLSFPGADGLSVYPAQPRLSDTGIERGEPRIGTRIESATYALQKEGAFQLPPVEIAWWDTNARVLRRSRLDAVDFSVAPNPGLQAEIPLPVDPEAEKAAAAAHDWRRYALTYGPIAFGVVVAVGLLVSLLRLRLDSLRAWWAARRRKREESEAAHLARVEKAARSGRPGDLLNATYRWLDRRWGTEGAARLDRFAEASGDPELPGLAEGLLKAALDDQGSGSADTSPDDFLKALLRAARRSSGRAAKGEALGPLNPRS